MLFAHGWITQSSDLETLDFQQEGDEVRVVDRHGAAPLSRQSQPLAAKERSRTFPPDQIPIQPEHPPFTFRLPASQINLLFDELVKRSRLHQTTRCTHSGALSDGNALLVLCEDVGRHNVADMLIGYALLNRIDLSDKLVVRTGRVALEIAEKFERAGLKMLLSLSVPTLGALEFARERGICLVSARRDRTILVFNGREHIVLESCV
jgi:formate dehydrogenase accessory protein FdhD